MRLETRTVLSGTNGFAAAAVLLIFLFRFSTTIQIEALAAFSSSDYPIMPWHSPHVEQTVQLIQYIRGHDRIVSRHAGTLPGRFTDTV